ASSTTAMGQGVWFHRCCQSSCCPAIAYPLANGIFIGASRKRASGNILPYSFIGLLFFAKNAPSNILDSVPPGPVAEGPVRLSAGLVFSKTFKYDINVFCYQPFQVSANNPKIPLSTVFRLRYLLSVRSSLSSCPSPLYWHRNFILSNGGMLNASVAVGRGIGNQVETFDGTPPQTHGTGGQPSMARTPHQAPPIARPLRLCHRRQAQRGHHSQPLR